MKNYMTKEEEEILGKCIYIKVSIYKQIFLIIFSVVVFISFTVFMFFLDKKINSKNERILKIETQLKADQYR